jgi:uncharacterized Zn-finger protein
MAEACAECGASLRSAEELARHRKSAHQGGDDWARLELSPDLHMPGAVCSLCGKRFRSREELNRHGLTPHYKSNRPLPPEPFY